MADIKQMIDSALGAQTTQVKVQYSTPDEYKEKTGKRFRLTKEEISKNGSDGAGRLAAFKARMESGKL